MLCVQLSTPGKWDRCGKRAAVCNKKAGGCEQSLGLAVPFLQPPLGDPQTLPHFSVSSPAGTDMAVFCLLCGKRFQTQTALQQHMEVHAGVRSYICSECNRTFPSHTALKRHLRSHTGTAKATESSPVPWGGRSWCCPWSPHLGSELCAGELGTGSLVAVTS